MITNLEIYEFLDLQIKLKYKTLAEFARALDMKPQAVSNTLKRLKDGQDFNFQNMNKILTKFGYNFVIAEIGLPIIQSKFKIKKPTLPKPEVKPVEIQAVEIKSVEIQAVETEFIEGVQPVEVKSTEVKTIKNK